MFLYGKPDAGLCAGDPFFCCKLYGALVLQIASHFDSHTLQSSFADAGSSHCDVCDDGAHLPPAEFPVKGSHRVIVDP